MEEITNDIITKKILENEVKNIWIQTCKKGNAVRLSTLYSIYKNPFFTSEEMILLVCKFDHLYILNWMCKMNDNLNIDFYNKLFVIACEYGHLDIVEWLIEYQNNLNIHYEDESALLKACENGHLNIIEFLMSFNDKPDIHIFNNLPFYIACKNDQLAVLEYLFSLEDKQNINWIHNLFFTACQNNKVYIGIYLLTKINEIDITTIEFKKYYNKILKYIKNTGDSVPLICLKYQFERLEKCWNVKNNIVDVKNIESKKRKRIIDDQIDDHFENPI